MSKFISRLEQYESFNLMVANLLLFAMNSHIPIRLGEAHRPAVLAELYAKKKLGILNSKHRQSLAIDLWVTDKEYGNAILWVSPHYESLGKEWESLGGRWGGKFKDKKGKPKPDIYHFELAEDVL